MQNSGLTEIAIEPDASNVDTHDSGDTGVITLMKILDKGQVRFEVAFPHWPQTMKFYTGERTNLGRIPLYRPGDSKPFDHARTDAEAANRLYHEARKFAYSHSGGARVHDPYRGEFKRLRQDFFSQ